VELREKKQKHCAAEEHAEAGDMQGICGTIPAIVGDSKLLLSLVVGKRMSYFSDNA